MIQQTLPRISIPLQGTDSDITLDLQPLLNYCYDVGHFGRQIDYTQEPSPALTGDNALWANALLREQSLRRVQRCCVSKRGIKDC